MSTRSCVTTPPVVSRSRRGHKERSKNFTEAEKRTVLELIARHRDVLRQGRSNNATNRSKQLVWSTICEEVNSRCAGDRPRTPAQVKMWYENYKKKCKMRAQDTLPQQDAPNILDGMLWQSINPLDIKDDEGEATTSGEGGHSLKDEDCIPVNMSNGRHSACNDTDEPLSSVLEPQIQITPQSPPSPPSTTNPAQALANHIQILNPLQVFEQAQLQQNLTYLQKLSEISNNTPLNLSHLDNDDVKRAPSQSEKGCVNRNKSESRESRYDSNSTSEEERLYFMAKRQHALWEHEARMKILNLELRQKEELFSLQKQLFLIELKLKMDFLEKASGK